MARTAKKPASEFKTFTPYKQKRCAKYLNRLQRDHFRGILSNCYRLWKDALRHILLALGILIAAAVSAEQPMPPLPWQQLEFEASKFGLRAFTFALAQELEGSGIKLAAVSPGPIDTGFIMSNIDNVADITFSQPMSTGDDVANEILKLCVNARRERSMPPISGLLTTMSYLFPWLGKRLQPLLNAKGRRVKRRLKAAMRAAEADVEH